MAHRQGWPLMSAFRKLDIAAFKAKQASQNFSSFSNFSSPEVTPPSPGTDRESDAVVVKDDLVGSVELEERVAQIGERAAIVEHDGGISREWAEGFAKLCTMPCPGNVPELRWLAVIDAAGRFIDRWAARAAALGWDTASVFGCHPTHPNQRDDLKGLCWLLGDREV